MVEAHLRVADFFCGIGGCAAALKGRAKIVQSIDINRRALLVYAANFQHPTCPKSVESIDEAEMRTWRADLWWMSPPCQPYTRRGKQRDDADPRAAALLSLLPKIQRVRPPYLVLENVPPFQGSRSRRRLLDALASADYQTREIVVCPSQLGARCRRERYYLTASRAAPLSLPAATYGEAPDAFDQLDANPPSALYLSPEIVRQYRSAMHLVDPREPETVLSCFTSAYGRSWVRSGSYLRTASGVRRFSPGEILRFLGFPASYLLPSQWPARRLWPLVGNTLSIYAARFVLSSIPEFGSALEAE